MTAPAPLAALALAAGEGRRLRPLTALRPKALCPVGNVPLLDLALRRVAPHVPVGPASVAVNAHHFAAQVVDHVGDRAHVAVEPGAEALGTAGALGGLRGWLDGRDVLVTNADVLTDDPLTALVQGWDGERCRLLVRPVRDGGRADFELAGAPVRYVGSCLLPWRLVRDLAATPSGLYEVLWRQRLAELDLVLGSHDVVDCGTPADYLRANLAGSGGASVVGDGAVVEGSLERCVVWPGAVVRADEVLRDAVRAGTAARPVTVQVG